MHDARPFPNVLHFDRLRPRHSVPALVERTNRGPSVSVLSRKLTQLRTKRPAAFIVVDRLVDDLLRNVSTDLGGRR